ncbi:hypothetical protein AX14_012902 [Amanita brunnescens Koide BX004]|nr:hypothetical protein AX14_012902 [Amanita brunnescens Koide BX004]
MMKRAQSRPETPRKKRSVATDDNQSRLDVYFSQGSPKKPAISDAATSTARQRSLPGPEVIDVDEIQDATINISTPSASKAKELSIVLPRPHTSTYFPLDLESVIYDPLSQSLPMSSVPYSFLAHAFVTLSRTRSRIQIINILTNTLRTIIHHHPQSLLPSLYLLSNSLAPAYASVELGLGPSIISRAIRNISGLSAAALKRLYNTTGDPGDVAFEAKTNLRTLIPHPPLLVTFVYESLLKIANCKGQGASKQKERLVERLLIAATGEEVRYLTRTLCQNLRVGAVRTSILTALARSMVMTPLSELNLPDTRESLHISRAPSIEETAREQQETHLANKYTEAEKLIKQVFVQHPNYDHIVTALLQNGLPMLSDLVPLTIGVPLHPTLGSPVRSLHEVYDILGDLPFSAEYKYDGQRAQIHASNEGSDARVKIFSRHLEDMTMKYPDVILLVESIFTEHPHIRSFIIDSEIVAIDPLTTELKSFQELSNRARKDVDLNDIRVSVCVFAFDLMYFNGEILLEKVFRERRKVLRVQFPPFKPSTKGAAQFDIVRSCESTEGEAMVQLFWKQAVESRCEGLMIKLLDGGEVEENGDETKNKSRRKPLPATYEPDKRTTSWLKLKKDYVAGVGDTLDLIPIGAWHGNGRKAQWWSPMLLALWDPDRGQPVAVCKCMSGFTDSFYKALAERYSLTGDDSNCSARPIWECDMGGFKPDVYFKPQDVWEIRGADITISPVSTAAQSLVDSSRGLSVRFPRFIKCREDKNIEDASTPAFVANMWKSQQSTSEKRIEADQEDPDIDLIAKSDNVESDS